MQNSERQRLRRRAYAAGLSDHHTCLIENTIDAWREEPRDKWENRLFSSVMDQPDADQVMKFFHQFKIKGNANNK